MNFEDVFHTDLKNEIENAGYIKNFSAGDVIVNMESYTKNIPVVISGSIKVIRNDEKGNELLLYYIKPGESCVVSILTALTNDTAKIKAIVEEDAKIILIPVKKAKEWIIKYPEWTDFIFKLYQKRFEELLNVVYSVAFLKIDSRILQLLKQKSLLYNSKKLKITHQQLADELGITREATSRVLKNMENKKIILLSRNYIELL